MRMLPFIISYLLWPIPFIRYLKVLLSTINVKVSP